VSVEVEECRLTKDIVLANIPAFPPTTLRALDMLSQDAPNVPRLVREISSDATLTAQLLKLANSPLFGFAARIGTVQHSVVALGLIRVRSLVVAVATTNYMRKALGTEGMSKCWRHTLASAMLCRELAHAAGMPGDHAYSYGLLHDIGRLGLLAAYPDVYDQVLRDAERDAASLLDAEKKRFGMDHCEAGRQLVEQWKLPPEFGVIAGRHHDPPGGGPFDFLALVHLACQMADALGYSVVTPLEPAPFDELRHMLPPAARHSFPADPAAVIEIISGTIDEPDSTTDVPWVERHPLTERGALPEQPGDDSGSVDRMEEPTVPTTRAARPTVWDATVVLTTTMLITIAVVMAYHLWSR
jgi:putative nucleotidyltransferase with HDIG domain